MVDRRTVIKGAAALGGLGLFNGARSSVFTAVCTDDAAGNERILVVLKLSGGNDGLNSIVPYGDDAYYRLRPGIGIRPGELLKLDEYWGMNPGMRGFARLWDAGQLAIVHGCGYERPSYSHATAANFWREALPVSRQDDSWSNGFASEITRDGAVRYPSAIDYGIAQFRQVAASVAAGLSRRIFHIEFGNNAFDTHVRQPELHRTLLSQAGNAMRTFLLDMERIRQAERVVVLVYSEFGRSAPENGSLGTDHGTANVMFLAGKGVRGGHYGRAPKLDELDASDNLVYTTDFRRVYATAFDGWLNLGVDAKDFALTGYFEPFPVFG